MKTGISSWAIRRPIPTIVLFLGLMIFGIFSFYKLPINADPNMAFPLVTVSVSQEGASAEELENAVTRQVENALSGMAGVRHITSSLTQGNSVTTVEFQLETDTDRAVNDVRNAISQIQGDLPQNISAPVVSRADTEGGALVYYAVESPNMNQTELAWFIDDTVSRRVLALSGVQQVNRIGGAKQEIQVLLKADKLQALGITAEQVSQQIALTNVNMPAGRTKLFDGEQSISVQGSSRDVETLAQMMISLGDNRQVRLDELADIKNTHAEIRSRSRLNGREVLGFNVLRSKGASDTQVMARVEQAVAELAEKYPDVRIQEAYNSVETTKENYKVAMTTLLEGAILTVLVVWLFLRNWRATLVAAIALPLSILPTFAVMHLLGYTLNSVTLLAITLVIGILVDDAIVEIENIETHLHQGKRPFQAALDASDAIGFAVVAITGTIVAVFLSVSFIGGVTGQYFSQFGVTVSAAVLASLLVARLATPLLAAYLLKPLHKNTHENQNKTGKLHGLYLALLAKALHFRKTTLLLGGVFMVASFALIPLLPTGFVPKGDTGRSQVEIALPPASTLAQTDSVLKQIEQRLQSRDDVAGVFVTLGKGGEINKGELLINLKPHSERQISQKQFEEELRQELQQFADMRFSFRNELAARDVSITLVGSDPQQLRQTAQTLKEQMATLPSLANIGINAPLMKPEVQVRLNHSEASRLGVTPQAVGNLLRIATVGDTGGNSARFNLSDRQLPIRVTLGEQDRNNLAVLSHLPVATNNGTTVLLNSVAELFIGETSSGIERFDRERQVIVEVDLTEGYTIGDVLNAVNGLPIMQDLPAGVKLPETGDAEYMSEMFEQFGMAMGFGILMVLMVLILLFRDFLQPLTILIALPLSIGGAMVGLLLYGAALDMSSVIGILMLMGIVTKNSILLVDFVIEKRKQGTDRHTALMQSGAERARPIVMTTIAMVAGMLPAVFASGAGAAFRAPMAIAVICGLITSTLLSLIFVPVFYALMDDVKNWLAPKLAKLTSVTEADRQLAEKMGE
ncbi:efflux RND transporter permease subunit [Wielerella bovis]|uniref:efflux RND transporter permease subunit n=1 Tax=Wielerella bovis TaxID=2917790 RepID=UPI002019CE3D|nr:efflux RND transporter permease subunit [Wielerella bovis]ULJ68530.1 efflux RND transporter permease subunit [Wielerella bovis]